MKVKLLAISLIFALVTCKSNSRQMHTSSMEQSIAQGEKITIEHAGILKRQDIIAFDYDHPTLGKNTWVFRVIGIPGDTIEIKRGVVYINGNLRRESYTKLSDKLADAGVFQPEILGSTTDNRWNVDNYGPIIIPLKGSEFTAGIPGNDKLFKSAIDKHGKIGDDLYFVLGDSRHDAYDSRFIGLVSKSNIVGVVQED